jgi:hypothetical protein
MKVDTKLMLSKANKDMKSLLYSASKVVIA